MIKIDLEINSRVLNQAAMDELRVRIREAMLPFIFDQVDRLADARGYRFSHTDVSVGGTIKEQA